MPRLDLRRYPQPAGGPIHRGGQLPQPRGWRYRLLVQGEYRLDESQHTGAALEVTDVGLDRADATRLVARPARAVHRGQRRDLGGISCGSSGSVCLDESDARRLDTGLLARQSEHVGLRVAVRRHDAHRSAVLCDGAATDHGQHPVAVAFGVGEPLEHHDARALAAAVTVGGIVERLAPAVGRGGARLVEHPHQPGPDQRADATGEGQRRLPRPQHLAGLVHRDEGRRARRVECDARTPQVQQMRYAIRDAAQRRSDTRPGFDPGQVLHDQLAVVVGVDAHQHRRVTARQRARRDACVLERLPADFEGEPLLRVHQLRFSR